MKYWQSIDDLPIYFYYKLIETSNLDLLIYQPPAHKMDENYKKEKLYAAWQNIELEFFDMMAQDKDYVNGLKKQLRKRIKRLDSLLKPEAFYKTLWEVEKRKEEETEVSFDYYGSIAALNKYLKFAIDDKKLIVRMYFTYHQIMKNGK